jgi:hypothetical protein
MSAPTSSATIEFPLSMIDDEIRKILEEEGVRFKPQVFGPNLELDDPLYDLEVEVEGGIFSLHNSEARYGEFIDLEELLTQKGIPFDRRSGQDWNRNPVLRIFRPGQPNFNENFPLDPDAYEPVVSVSTIRELLERTDTEEGPAENIRDYLNFNFPSYPPLTDWVQEEQKS